MKNKKGKIVKIIIGVVVLCAIIASSTINKMKPKEIRTYDVIKGDIETVISGSGTIAANTSRKQYAKINGEVMNIFFEEGDKVSARRFNNEA